MSSDDQGRHETIRDEVEVPPATTEVPSGRIPRDAADPGLTPEQRRARTGSAGGGSYSPGAPGHGLSDD